MKQPKEQRSLEIKSLQHFNEDLLGKWFWRFNIEQDHLWRRVVIDKYGLQGIRWITVQRRETLGTSIWKNIVKGWPKFKQNMSIMVRDGKRALFWHDNWCGK